MVRAEIEVSRLQQAIENVTVLVEEAKLEFSPGELRVQTVDPANVGAVRLSLSESAFEAYKSPGENVCLDLQRLRNIISQIESDKILTLSVDPEPRFFKIEAPGYEFDLPLLTEESVRVGHDVDTLNHPVEMEIDSEELLRASRLASMFADSVAIGTDPGRDLVYLNADGENDSMQAIFGREDLMSLDMGEAHSYYSLTYLQKLANTVPGDKNVLLGIGNEYPAKMEFEFADGAGNVAYSLAPRIQ